jgi:hypothetical protein
VDEFGNPVEDQGDSIPMTTKPRQEPAGSRPPDMSEMDPMETAMMANPMLQALDPVMGEDPMMQGMGGPGGPPVEAEGDEEPQGNPAEPSDPRAMKQSAKDKPSLDNALAPSPPDRGQCRCGCSAKQHWTAEGHSTGCEGCDCARYRPVSEVGGQSGKTAEMDTPNWMQRSCGQCGHVGLPRLGDTGKVCAHCDSTNLRQAHPAPRHHDQVPGGADMLDDANGRDNLSRAHRDLGGATLMNEPPSRVATIIRMVSYMQGANPQLSDEAAYDMAIDALAVLDPMHYGPSGGRPPQGPVTQWVKKNLNPTDPNNVNKWLRHVPGYDEQEARHLPDMGDSFRKKLIDRAVNRAQPEPAEPPAPQPAPEFEDDSAIDRLRRGRGTAS